MYFRLDVTTITKFDTKIIKDDRDLERIDFFKIIQTHLSMVENRKTCFGFTLEINISEI